MFIDLFPKTRRFLLSILYLTLLANLSWAQGYSQIEQLHKQWKSAFAAGDGSLAAMYTEDAYVVPMCGQPVKGSYAIANFWREQAVYFDIEFIKTVNIKAINSATAIEIGELSFAPKNRAVIPPSCVSKKDRYVANYVVLWQRVDGQWKMAIDIWNLGDLPASRI